MKLYKLRQTFRYIAIITMVMFFTACGGSEDEALAQIEVTEEAIKGSTPTIEPTTTITPTPEPAYELCPNIEDFRDCFVPEEELLNGDYWNWLNKVVALTLLEDFKAREDQIRDDIPIQVVGWSSGGVFFYAKDGGVYEDEETTAPWNRKVTFATTSMDNNDRASECMILPVFYYDKTTQQVYPVVTIIPIRNTWGEEEEKEERIKLIMNLYINTMNMPAIFFTSTRSGSFEKENITMTVPLVSEFYERLGQEEVWKRTESFFNGDYSAFSGPDMAVAASVAEGEIYQ